MFTSLIRRFSSLEHSTSTTNPIPALHGRRDSEDLSRHHDNESGHNQKHQRALSPSNNISSAADGVSGVFTPSHRSGTPLAGLRPLSLDPLVLHGYHDDTPASARLLSNALAEEIRIMVPERFRIGEDWRLIYSLDQDGASLATLYQRCRQFEGRRAGFVLVVKDGEGCVLGAYLSEYPHPAPTYFGNGECFLWRASPLPSLPLPPSDDSTNLFRATTLMSEPVASSPLEPVMIRFKAFPYSGINEYFVNCETRFLSVGAGDAHYGLWLDDTLERGHSSASQTFGNEPLSDEGEKFDIIGVELWALGA